MSKLSSLQGSRGLGPTTVAGSGVNTEPGSNDDGWMHPPWVKLSNGSSVRLYKDGEALKAAYDAIAAAKHRICMEFYIWADDATGQAFAELLIRKSKEGVKVFVIYDSFGVNGLNDRTMFKRMANAGIRVAEFHPIRPWDCKFSWRPFGRDHRKIVVVDDQFAGVGGLNIAESYAGSWVAPAKIKPAHFWRDTGVAISGPATRLFLQAFIKNWHYIHKGGHIRRTQYFGHVDVPRVRRGYHAGTAREDDLIIANEPVLQDDIGLIATAPCLNSPLRPLLHTMLNRAKKSIRMTMAYFGPDDDLIESLCAAARRGVDVELMFGGKSDLPIMITVARAFYERMMTAGVKIFERQHVILHAKTMCIDDDISVIGSTNLDYRSIEFNLESSAIIRSAEFASHLNSMFENDIHYARPISLSHWKRRPYWDRFVQSLVKRFRYVL